jgi:hypothetical protein
VPTKFDTLDNSSPCAVLHTAVLRPIGRNMERTEKNLTQSNLSSYWVGVALNQKLSEDRANNVTNILLQQGNVPLTRMLAPVQWGRANK